jgi:hypothetical protein
MKYLNQNSCLHTKNPVLDLLNINLKWQLPNHDVQCFLVAKLLQQVHYDWGNFSTMQEAIHMNKVA